MEIRLTHEVFDANEGAGPVLIGWLLDVEAGGVVYPPPARVRSADMDRNHAKSASRCPAILNLESRYIEVKCPFDLQLSFVRDKDGRPGLRNVLGSASPVRGKKLKELLYLVDESEWRYPNRPTVQLQLPYVFLSDEPVYLCQTPPFLHYREIPWPGTLFGGRFPIDVWPRPLMWAFEWHDTDRELELSRGEPLFYCQIETVPPDRSFRLVEVERTAELQAYLQHISGAVNYVNQTFSLFRAAREQRPETLVTPRDGKR